MHLCHWQCHQHYMLPMPVVTALHDQKSHVAANFDYLDQANAVVPLKMPLALHDADAGASGITWWKKSYCISFWSSWPNKWSGAIDDTFGIIWHWHQHKCCTLNCSDLMNTVLQLTVLLMMAVLTVSNNWKIMLHLISVIFKYQMQWC